VSRRFHERRLAYEDKEISGIPETPREVLFLFYILPAHGVKGKERNKNNLNMTGI